MNAVEHATLVPFQPNIHPVKINILSPSQEGGGIIAPWIARQKDFGDNESSGDVFEDGAVVSKVERRGCVLWLGEKGPTVVSMVDAGCGRCA